MAINVEAELKSQLDALDEKLAGLEELRKQRERIANALGVLTGTLKVGGQKVAKVDDGIKSTMSESHKMKIKLSNLKRRAAEHPQDNELQRKVKDVEASIASLG